MIKDLHGHEIIFDDQNVLTVRKLPIIVTAFQAKVSLRVDTKEGVMLCNPGDYIIEGIAGELYPCAKEIFEQTYEEI